MSLKNQNKKYQVIVFLLIAMFLFGFAVSSQAQSSSTRNAQQDYLLSELLKMGRFSVSYPMLNYPYGNESSFTNAGWTHFLASYGAGWRVMWDSRTGRPNLIEGKGIPFYAGKGNKLAKDFDKLTIQYLHNKIMAFVDKNNNLLRLDFAALQLNKDGSQIFDNGRYCVVQYDYYMNGVPVEGGRVFFRFNNGNLIQFGSLGISNNKIATEPAINGHQAEDNVTYALSDENTAVDTINDTKLKVVPEMPEGQNAWAGYAGKEGYGLSYRLVWAVQFTKSTSNNTYEAWVDGKTGKIVNQISLTLSGNVYGDVSIRPGNRTNKQFPFCSITNNGSKTTEFWGWYLYSGSPSPTASSTLSGNYFNMVDNCGSINLSSSTSPGNLNFGSSSGTDCDTPGSGGAGNTYAARSAFWHANMERAKAKYFLPGIAWFDLTVNIATNVAGDSCNAFWSGTSPGNITFLQSDTDCNNTGEIGGTIYHEFGHGLDHNDGGPEKTPTNEKASGEAWGDFIDALNLKDACHSQGMYKVDTCFHCPVTCHGTRYIAMRFDDDGNPNTPEVPVRPINILLNSGVDCDGITSCTDCPYTYADPTCATPTSYRGIIGYEGHCESHIASGALWDMLQSMFTAWGEKGYTWADRIWYESIPSMGSAYQITSGGECNILADFDGCAATNWYTVLLGADDDDGNLTNGTPNGGRIWNAFNDHGISCGSAPANYNVCIEPSTPTLYAAPSDGEIGLTWTVSYNATGYKVFVNFAGTSADCAAGGWLPLATVGNVNSYALMQNMWNGIGYSFAVQAINGSDDCVSSMSNCVFAQPTASALPNLTGYKPAAWDNAVVPSDNSCTTSTCSRSAVLTPGTAKFNFNVYNNSSVASGTHTNTFYGDDEIINSVITSVNAHVVSSFLSLSMGLKGGRHMLKLVLDSGGDVTESVETDNTWIAPVAVFVPYDLDTDADHMITRDAPPDRNPAGYSYYSCDGYQFSVAPASGQGYWGVVGILPSTSTANYDVRLHDDYTGSGAGFATNRKWSNSSGNGGIEFIGVNRNQSPTATWWAGVINGTDTPSTSNYAIHKDISESAVSVPSTGNTGNIPANGVLAVEEIFVDSTDLATTWRVQVTPSGGDIGIALIGNTMQYFNIADATFNVNNQGTNFAEWFDYQFPVAGYYGLVIYKTDYAQLPNSVDYTLSISIAPSNLHPYTATGWTHAVVARSSNGCTMGGCTVTATLPGWSGTTYVNSTNINDGPNPVTVSFEVRYLLDDATLEDISFAGLGVGVTALNTDNTLTGSIKGGRHTLGVYVDANNDYGELDEFDNRFYTQYVWSPYTLANNTPFTTTAPPDRTTAGGFTYYNCDGYQFDVVPSGGQNYWGVIGILPTGGSGSTSNYDIRLHDDYTGAIDGFRIPVVASDTGTDGQVELIGINRNNTTTATWWASVTQGNSTTDTANYYIYKDLSGSPIAVPSSGTTGNIPANGIANVEEIYLDSTDLGLGWTVTVTPTGGDIGIALMDQSVEYFRLGDAVSGTNVNNNGTNAAESFNFVPTVAGYYGLIIYKPDNTEVANSINYTITISLALSNLKPTQPSG